MVAFEFGEVLLCRLHGIRVVYDDLDLCHLVLDAIEFDPYI